MERPASPLASARSSSATPAINRVHSLQRESQTPTPNIKSELVQSTPKHTHNIKQEAKTPAELTPSMQRKLNFPDNMSMNFLNLSEVGQRSNKKIVSPAERLGGDLAKLILTFLMYRRLHIIWYTMAYN